MKLLLANIIWWTVVSLLITAVFTVLEVIPWMAAGWKGALVAPLAISAVASFIWADVYREKGRRK